MAQLRHILTHVLISHTPLVEPVEIRIKRDEHLFVGKLFTPERHIAVKASLLPEIFKLLSIEKMQIKIAHISCESQTSGVGHENRGVVAAMAHIVYHNIVEHSGFSVFMLHKKIIAGNLVIEHPFGNLYFRRLLTHGEKQRPHLDLRGREHIILKKERPHRHYRNQHYQRAHGMKKRNS